MIGIKTMLLFGGWRLTGRGMRKLPGIMEIFHTFLHIPTYSTKGMWGIPFWRIIGDVGLYAAQSHQIVLLICAFDCHCM